MEYVVDIEGLEGHRLVMKTGFWSGPKLLLDGLPVPKGDRKGDMLLQLNGGRQTVARWKPQIMGLDVPQLVVDDRTVVFVEPLKWYQWVWGGWPVLLIFAGGALGAVAGVLSFSVNARIFRAGMNAGAKYFLTALVSLTFLIVYLVLASLVYLAINK